MAHFLAELRRKVPEVEALPDSEPASTKIPYVEPSYWEERYRADGPAGGNFEWLLTWRELEAALAPELERLEAKLPGVRALHPGCGNSTLGDDLRQAGYAPGGLLNTDISITVIEQMRAQLPESVWEVDDCLDMAVARQWVGNSGDSAGVGQFDIVVDKSTLDCLICIEGPEQVKVANVRSYFDQVRGVLAPEGAFLIISNAPPEVRQKIFDQVGWKLTREPRRICKESTPSSGGDGAVPSTVSYFLYVAVPADLQGSPAE